MKYQQVRITNLHKTRETVNLPKRLTWEGRFYIGLGHTLLGMYEQVTRGRRCFIHVERTPKDQEWQETDRVNYEEYIEWIQRDVAAGEPIMPYIRPKTPAWKLRGRGSVVSLVCLVLLSACAEYHSPVVTFPPPWIDTPEGRAFSAREDAKQDARMLASPVPLSVALAYLYDRPKSVHPAAAWAPLPSTRIAAQKAERLWDACSIYGGIDESVWRRISRPTREEKVYQGNVRGYRDRKFKMPAHKQPPVPAGTSERSVVDEPQRPANWEDLYQFEGDGQLGPDKGFQ